MSELFNSITVWYPILKKTGVLTPKTIIVHSDVELGPMVDGERPERVDGFIDRLEAACREVGYPAFLRTSHLSDKHDWKDTCFVTEDCDIEDHVYRLVESSFMANIAGRPWPYDFWAVREMIRIDPYFHAFQGNMPITRELRYFIKDGKVLCRHPYWPTEAFKHEKDGWQEKLDEMNNITQLQSDIVDELAAKVAKFFGGFWSVDFMQAADGRWYCIDMADGKDSYHYPGCEHNHKEVRK